MSINLLCRIYEMVSCKFNLLGYMFEMVSCKFYLLLNSLKPQLHCHDFGHDGATTHPDLSSRGASA